MKPIPHQLASLIETALQAAQAAGTVPALAVPETPVTRPKNADQGDYASPIAMALAKAARMKPLDIAQAIAQHLPRADFIAGVEVAPPGFLNFRLSQEWVRAQVEAIISEPGFFQQPELGAGRKAQVEFVSANPTGPLHIGRTRGAVLGDTLATLLEACGWDVQREYYFNNAGQQMMKLGKSLQARYLQALGREAAVPEEGYQGEYLIDMGAQLKAEVAEAWADQDWQPFKEYAEKQIFEMIQATLARIGIHFDHFFNENSLYESQAVWQTLERLKAAGHIYEAAVREGSNEDEAAAAEAKKLQPALWFRTTSFGDGEDRVVVRSNGDPTYALPDIAYHIDKLDRGFDRAINILGTDHIIEAQTVQRGLQALGYDASKVEVLLHQFVNFGENRMSTRKGNYVTLDDLIDEVGPDVVRYFMIGRSHNSHIDFDFDLAKQQSNDNPVYYIQNAYVRCCGIFRQVEERGHPANWDEGADLSLLGDTELGFILKALELPEQMLFAHDNLVPHQLAFYAVDLARNFHPLYDEIRVLHSEVPEDVARARLRFYRAARVTFAYVLHLLGMSAPERM